MEKQAQASEHYRKIARAIEYLSAHQSLQPDLEDIANHVGISKFHFQRLFSEWVGVSPKQFLQYLTTEYAKQKLLDHSVFDTAVDCGLSGSSRLHDLFVGVESVTPGEYKSQGKHLTIDYGFHESPFGICLVAKTDRGICHLSFLEKDDHPELALSVLKQEWSQASIQCDQEATRLPFNAIFDQQKQASSRLNILMKGSPFQLKVWEALLRLREGQLCSYQSVAQAIGQPKAHRAVASAIAQNRIAVLIPCHRVIRSTGAISQYRWGDTRKKALVAWEASHQN